MDAFIVYELDLFFDNILNPVNLTSGESIKRT